MNYNDIRFPHLGIVLNNVGRTIHIGSFEIMFYGMIIALGFFLGLLAARAYAKRTGQDPELYTDFVLWMIIPSIIGARLYYVIFSWDYYGQHPEQILNLRAGGLGIVGGVAAAAIVLVIFAKRRKVKISLMLDTVTMGLLIGQIMGRWGNFFNREAFGGYTDGLLAMQIPVKYFEANGRIGEITATGLLERTVNVNVGGQTLQYIQVHPTFLYEGLWNLALLLIIYMVSKKKKFDGQLISLYFMGYGIGRFFIEGLRVDQLKIGHTGIAATQVVCILIFLLGLIFTISKIGLTKREKPHYNRD